MNFPSFIEVSQKIKRMCLIRIISTLGINSKPDQKKTSNLVPKMNSKKFLRKISRPIRLIKVKGREKIETFQLGIKTQ